MKNILSLITATLMSTLFVYSQAPGIFNYQGIARNSVGNALENKTITLRLTVHDISSTGPVVYQESRTVTTNPFGLFNVQVGGAGATQVTGSIAAVNWALGNKYLQVEIDPAGGTSFIRLGVSQLASVPYALNAVGASPIGPAGGDLSGTYPNPSVTRIRGINLSSVPPSINSVLSFDGTNWTPVSLSSPWLTNGNHIYNSNNGYIGIGTSTPEVNLHIKDNGTSTMGLDLQGTIPIIRFRDPAGNTEATIENLNTDLGMSADRNINFFTGNAWSMTIQNNGRVGIGTGNPGAKLHIAGNNEALSLRGADPFISFYNGSSYKGYLGAFANNMHIGTPTGNSSGNLQFYTNGNARMSLMNNGRLDLSKDDEAMRLTGNDGYISFYDGVSYKGFVGATDNDIELGTPNSNTTGNIVIYQNGALQLIVQNDGRVRVGPLGCNILLGGTYPPPKFSVFGSLGFKKNYPDYIGEWAIAYNEDRPPPHSPPFNSLKFYYNGGLKAWVDDIDGDWHYISDKSLKEAFESYKPVLEGIKKLDIMTYYFKSNQTAKRSFGLIAQNVQQYFPEIVSSAGTDGIMGISYSKTGVLAIKAIQEQQVIIETLEKQLEVLEKRLAALEYKLR